MLWVSTPEVARVSLLEMVLLTMVHVQGVFQRDSRAIPARHVVHDDVVGDEHPCSSAWESRGSVETSVPLTCCRRIPPPLPLSAALAWIRLALMTRPGPVPSLSPGGQSASMLMSRKPDRYRVCPSIDSAAVGGNGGVGALVESDRVVLDVAVVIESKVSDAAAFAELTFPHTQL